MQHQKPGAYMKGIDHLDQMFNFVDFLSQCIERITTPIEKNHQLLDNSDNSSNRSPHLSPDTASRLLSGIKNQTLVKIPQVGKRTNTVGQCQVCSVKGSAPKCTSFVCSSCNIPLCTDSCISRYHSVKHFKK
ncbi:hypothetical protein PR048_003654 [Dryococelus australis]|uniref:PiggyBac transposable element-derived protein 4 C-terminal zinc-finger domain-containing protein n=1 Tax=Dryococelus australis TaxID=614101 RepID=A0ABQ9INS3_9NEOP|nr:hypothetical protein PR048_003654 [Dryococelus australis]